MCRPAGALVFAAARAPGLGSTGRSCVSPTGLVACDIRSEEGKSMIAGGENSEGGKNPRVVAREKIREEKIRQGLPDFFTVAMQIQAGRKIREGLPDFSSSDADSGRRPTQFLPAVITAGPSACKPKAWRADISHTRINQCVAPPGLWFLLTRAPGLGSTGRSCVSPTGLGARDIRSDEGKSASAGGENSERESARGCRIFFSSDAASSQRPAQLLPAVATAGLATGILVPQRLKWLINT